MDNLSENVEILSRECAFLCSEGYQIQKANDSPMNCRIKWHP